MKEAIQISLRGVENKSTSLGVRKCGADMWMWIIQDGLKVLAREIDIFTCCVSLEAERWHQCTAHEWEQVQGRGEERMLEVCEVKGERWQKKEEAREIKWNRRTERKQKRGKEDREWLMTRCVEWSGRCPRGEEVEKKWRGDGMTLMAFGLGASSFYEEHELNIAPGRAAGQAMVRHAKQSWQKHWFPPSSSSKPLR